MADRKPIKFIVPIPDNPFPGYSTMYSANPATRGKVQNWLDSDQTFNDYIAPLGPGQKPNLDDPAAQSLQDAMRLRMQLPR